MSPPERASGGCGPAGTPSGRTFRVRGKGVHKSNGETGDLLVSIEVAVPTYLGGDAKAKLEEYAKLANEPNPRTELLAGG